LNGTLRRTMVSLRLSGTIVAPFENFRFSYVGTESLV
jgi:hypothetical protein